jgi:PAS domain S-box-containing protein
MVKKLVLNTHDVSELYEDVSIEVKLKKHHRCHTCNKLLAIENFILPSFDIKCARCGEVNSILKDVERQVLITDEVGTILYVNREVEKVTGYSAKEILGSRPSLWGKQMSPAFYKDLWDQILVQKKAVAVEMTNRNKNGNLYKVVLRISPILNDKSEVEFFLGIETVLRDSDTVFKTNSAGNV